MVAPFLGVAGRAVLWVLDRAASAALGYAVGKGLDEGLKLIQRNSELSTLAGKLNDYEKSGEINNVFNTQVQNTQAEFEEKLQDALELTVYKLSEKRGISYRSPISSVFRRHSL